MHLFSKEEKDHLCALIRNDRPLPDSWRTRLFPNARHAEIGKEYRLVYDGKLTREEVLAQTPAAPWQLVRSFCPERPHLEFCSSEREFAQTPGARDQSRLTSAATNEGRWRNLLVWGDNLLALRELLADQVLKVDNTREAAEAVVHKYDAFLNLLCADRYAFQRDAVRETLRFLVSDKYPDLERLARENWNAREAIRQRHESMDAYLAKMPLKGRKAVSLDLATGTGKSYVMYALAAIALAEGLADRVLVLCPSLTRSCCNRVSPALGKGILRDSGPSVSTGRAYSTRSDLWFPPVTPRRQADSRHRIP